jgi:hypothetical protein
LYYVPFLAALRMVDISLMCDKSQHRDSNRDLP